MNRREAIKTMTGTAAALAVCGTLPAATAAPLAINDEPFFGMPRRFADGRLVWRNLEVIPGELVKLVDALNDAPLFGCDRGTLKFGGFHSRVLVYCDGRRHVVTLPFRRRETDWNLFSMFDGTLREIRFTDTHGKPAYPYVDVPGLISDFAAKTGRYPELTLEFETGASHRDPQLQE